MKKRISGNLIKFVFEDNVPPFTFDTTKVSGANRAFAIPVAFSHRLGDAAAGYKTETERRAAVVALADHYLSGSNDWNTRVAVKSLNATWLAIAEKRGVSYDIIAAEQAQKALDELAALG